MFCQKNIELEMDKWATGLPFSWIVVINVQRAIVFVSPFHDFVSWLIQSRLAWFPLLEEKTFLKDSYLTVTMAATILSTKRA